MVHSRCDGYRLLLTTATNPFTAMNHELLIMNLRPQHLINYPKLLGLATIHPKITV